MSTWLTTIVMNSLRVVDSLDGKQDNNAVLSTLSDPSPTPEEICRKWELANHIAVVSERLSPTMHRTFELRYIHGFNVKETAEALGVTVGTARVYLSRARARIKQELYKSSGRRKHPD
jgi:RNA polymerase sigma factor (sigma-70 family)